MRIGHLLYRNIGACLDASNCDNSDFRNLRELSRRNTQSIVEGSARCEAAYNRSSLNEDTLMDRGCVP